MAGFKFDSASAFLTYPQLDATVQALYEALCAVAPVEWARVCRELHEDGQPHLHAVVKFKSRVQSRRPDIFDFAGKHPNIQSIRSIAKALEYVSKDGDFEDFGAVPTFKKRSWEDIVSAAGGDEGDWLRVVHEERMGPHVAKRLRELHSSTSADLDEYDGRPIAPIFATLPDTFTSLLVVGRPGIGKTGWAMSIVPRPCLLVKHLDSLRLWRTGYHKSILFDDCSFKHRPREEQMMIADYENQVQLHCRYAVANIPARVPRLFLCNPGHEPFIEDPAIQGRRVRVIRIGEFVTL